MKDIGQMVKTDVKKVEKGMHEVGTKARDTVMDLKGQAKGRMDQAKEDAQHKNK